MTEEAIALTPLRQGLDLIKGAQERDGSPTWLLVDPVRNLYFKIPWRTFLILSYWCDPLAENADTLKQLLLGREHLNIDDSEIDSLREFLYKNDLAETSPSGGDYYYQRQKSAKQKWYLWLIHNYLFVKIPLLRPTDFLVKSFPCVSWVFSKKAVSSILIVGILGVYFSLRQWDQFETTFLYFLSVEGIAGYVVSLIVLKILHELGHAYTAVKYGCKVPTMGVAFLVMFPVLYTDASDAWRLSSRRQRMHIASAGMLVELGVAFLATFAWSFLPDGVLRSIAFFLATTSWIASFIVNLNPFMRFDGYYLLSDLMRVDNLQERAFQHARIELRYQLFGVVRRGLSSLYMPIHRRLVIYAWLVWIYRFFLFLGIAVLVYEYFFKALGIILFVVEILWFIVNPIFRELKEWYQLKEGIMKNKRSYFTFFIMFVLLVALCFPWSAKVSFPAILEAEESHVVYASHPGKVVQVYTKEGDTVESGAILLKMESNDLKLRSKRASEELDIVEQRLRWTPINRENRAELQVLLSEKERILTELQGLGEREEQLEIRSPLSGTVVDVEESLMPGRWITDDLPLLQVLNKRRGAARGYVEEKYINRLMVGQSGRFYSDDPMLPAIEVVIEKISRVGMTHIDIPYLSSRLDGDIAVTSNAENQDVPESAVYGLFMKPKDPVTLRQVQRGVVVVEATRESIIARYAKHALSVLIREMGF